MCHDRRSCGNAHTPRRLQKAFARTRRTPIDQRNADIRIQQVAHLKYSRIGARFCLRPSGKIGSPLIASIRANHSSSVSFFAPAKAQSILPRPSASPAPGRPQTGTPWAAAQPDCGRSRTASHRRDFILSSVFTGMGASIWSISLVYTIFTLCRPSFQLPACPPGPNRTIIG